MPNLKRLATVSAATLLFLQIADPSFGSTSPLRLAIESPTPIQAATQNTTVEPSLTPEAALLTAAPMSLPALMAYVETNKGLGAKDMQAISILAKKITKARTPKGAKAAGAEIAKERYGWGRYQFSCLETLWNRESSWNFRARNPRSGAYGIPQALPASKMEIRGKDWRTNPLTQISWGLHYIDVRYETPCKALRKFQRSRYY